MARADVVRGDVNIRDACLDLRKARTDAGLSADSVAAGAGIGLSALRNYEALIREPDLDVLRRWAGALGREVVFDVRAHIQGAHSDETAARIARMDESRAELAARMIELIEVADIGHTRAALAALDALIGAASGQALPVRRDRT